MTLWRKPKVGDILRDKRSGDAHTVKYEYAPEWFKHYKDKYEFVTVIPIEPPPEPLKRTVYLPVYTSGDTIVSGAPIHDVTGEEAKRRTSEYGHRVGVIRVELVEGQYDD